MSFKDISIALDQVFAGSPWFGTGVLKKLESLPAGIANQEYGPHGHSVGKYLRHMLVWRRYAIRKLQGDTDYRIALGSAEDFPEGEEPLAVLVEELRDSQRSLLELIQQADEALYGQHIDSKSAYTFGQLLQGIIQHDIYHLGQIALLARLMEPA